MRTATSNSACRTLSAIALAFAVVGCKTDKGATTGTTAGKATPTPTSTFSISRGKTSR